MAYGQDLLKALSAEGNRFEAMSENVRPRSCCALAQGGGGV